MKIAVNVRSEARSGTALKRDPERFAAAALHSKILGRFANKRSLNTLRANEEHTHNTQTGPGGFFVEQHLQHCASAAVGGGLGRANACIFDVHGAIRPAAPSQ